MIDSSKPSVETIFMFFIIAIAGVWVLCNSRRFTNMTTESWRTMGMLQNKTPRPLSMIVRLFVILFGLMFIGLGLFMGLKGVTGR